MTSPEFLPEAPAAVATLLGAQAPLMTRYARHLATSGTQRGLIGPREVPRLWQRHILNCAVLSSLLNEGEHVVDVGSGAGLPGVVLAIARPDLTVTLVEPLLRRTTWLTEIVAELSLVNVTVRRARADALHGQLLGDVVTSRAVAPLATLAQWCLPLVRPGGRMLALKGRNAAEEITGAAATVSASGGRNARVIILGDSVVEEPATVVEISRVTGRRSKR